MGEGTAALKYLPIEFTLAERFFAGRGSPHRPVFWGEAGGDIATGRTRPHPKT